MAHQHAQFVPPRDIDVIRSLSCYVVEPATVIHLPYLETLCSGQMPELIDEYWNDLAPNGDTMCLAVVAGWWCDDHDREVERDEEMVMNALDARWEVELRERS